MTEQEAIQKIRAEKAAYMREWRKKNKDKTREYTERAKERKIQKYMREEDSENERKS